MSKENNIKEKFKIALSSTEKVISDDYLKKNSKIKKNKSDLDYFEIDTLNSKEEFIKYRAESDSRGLFKKFSDEIIYKQNYPKNASCIALYEFSEKIRCELLGSEMLKGSKINFIENYKNNLSKTRTVRPKPIAKGFCVKPIIKTRNNVPINSVKYFFI